MNQEFKSIPAVLTETDNIITDNPGSFTSINDFILVHKTNFMPEASMIKTTMEAGGTKEGSLIIEGTEFKFDYLIPRNTIHFAVNSEVSPNTGGGDFWNHTKYTILIPMADIPKTTIREAAPSDTYVEGNVKLTNNAWILCPESEIELVKQKNPCVNVVGYEGDKSLGYADALLSKLGYCYEKTDFWSFINRDSEAKYRRIMDEEGLTYNAHAHTTDYSIEKINININYVTEIIKLIKENNLVTMIEDINLIVNALIKDSSFMSCISSTIYANDEYKLRIGHEPYETFIKKLNDMNLLINEKTLDQINQIVKLDYQTRETYFPLVINNIISSINLKLFEQISTLDALEENRRDGMRKIIQCCKMAQSGKLNDYPINLDYLIKRMNQKDVWFEIFFEITRDLELFFELLDAEGIIISNEAKEKIYSPTEEMKEAGLLSQIQSIILQEARNYQITTEELKSGFSLK